MATIKSFTDLSQSNTLSKILPLESADMLWGYYYNGKNHCIPNIRPFRDGRNEIPKWYIPAWSLAALLEILKDKIVYGSNTPDGWFCSYTVKNPTRVMMVYKDNLVNACYEVIIELHELNLL